MRAWLTLDPEPDAVAQTLTDSLARRSGTREVVAEYSRQFTEKERTDLVDAILDRHATPAWVNAVSTHGVDDDALSERLAAEAETASSVSEREKRVDLLLALRPGTSKAQRRVAQLIEHLLASGKRGDFDVALKAVDGLGNRHQSTERLKRAFRTAIETHNFSVPPKAAESLGRAGIDLPKKTIGGEARKILKRFIG